MAERRPTASEEDLDVSAIVFPDAGPPSFPQPDYGVPLKMHEPDAPAFPMPSRADDSDCPPSMPVAPNDAPIFPSASLSSGKPPLFPPVPQLPVPDLGAETPPFPKPSGLPAHAVGDPHPPSTSPNPLPPPLVNHPEPDVVQPEGGLVFPQFPNDATFPSPVVPSSPDEVQAPAFPVSPPMMPNVPQWDSTPYAPAFSASQVHPTPEPSPQPPSNPFSFPSTPNPPPALASSPPGTFIPSNAPSSSPFAGPPRPPHSSTGTGLDAGSKPPAKLDNFNYPQQQQPPPPKPTAPFTETTSTPGSLPQPSHTDSPLPPKPYHFYSPAHAPTSDSYVPASSPTSAPSKPSWLLSSPFEAKPEPDTFEVPAPSKPPPASSKPPGPPSTVTNATSTGAVSDPVSQPEPAPAYTKPPKPSPAPTTANTSPPTPPSAPAPAPAPTPTPSKPPPPPAAPPLSSTTPNHSYSQPDPEKQDHHPHPHSFNPMHHLQQHFNLPSKTQMETQYVSMLLALDDIPPLHNMAASFFTWVLLAGFILFPGTFESLENMGNNGTLNVDPRVVNAVKHVPLFVIAWICTAIGIVGMTYCTYRWHKNYIWCLNKVFLPGFMNSLAGLLSTLANLFGVQHGQLVTTSKVTLIITSVATSVTGVLTVIYSLWLVRRVKAKHDAQVGEQKTGEFGEGVTDLSTIKMQRGLKEKET